MIVVGAVLCVASVGVALAATSITTPSTHPFSVPGDASGNPLPFTVVATGFATGQQVFVEQCDNVPATNKFWDPTVDCDLASSNAPVQADATGTATFVATDLNHRFVPFKGASPQQSFNCLSPTQPDPANGLPSFTDCQIRVSSNNGSATSDQAFLTIVLPNTPAVTTTSSGATTTSSGATTTQPATTTSAPGTTTSSPTTTTQPVTTTTHATTTTVHVTTTTHPATTTSMPVTTTTHATTTTVHVTTTTHPATTTTRPATTTTSDPTTTTTLGTTTTLRSQSVSTTTTIAPTVLVSGSGDPTLPRTGGSPTPLLLVGLGLVATGLALVIGGTLVTRQPRYS